MPPSRPEPKPRGAASTASIAGIEVEIVHKAVERLTLRVWPPYGRVTLVAPPRTPRRELERLVAERADWIATHQRRYRALSSHGAAAYADGETHYLRGLPLTLERADGHAPSAHPDQAGARLLLRAPAGTDDARLRRAVEALHRRTLLTDLAPLVRRWEERLGTSVSAVGVKRMTTRWGSCNPRARRIWLNLALAQRRPALLEYVVVHELAHLFVPNHGREFKALMTELLPPWRELGRELDAWPIWARLPPGAAPGAAPGA